MYFRKLKDSAAFENLIYIYHLFSCFPAWRIAVKDPYPHHVYDTISHSHYAFPYLMRYPVCTKSDGICLLLPVCPASPTQGFDNCSFRNHLEYPTQILNCNTNAIQNHAFFSPSDPNTRLGNIGPGPFASGAQALATIVAILPSTCAHTKVKVMWNLVKV